MIERVGLRSQRDISATANPAHRTVVADAASCKECLMFQWPCGSTQNGNPG